MLQTPIGEVQERLDLLGLSRGWGNTVGRCKSTVILMLELLQVHLPCAVCVQKSNYSSGNKKKQQQAESGKFGQ